MCSVFSALRILVETQQRNKRRGVPISLGFPSICNIDFLQHCSSHTSIGMDSPWASVASSSMGHECMLPYTVQHEKEQPHLLVALVHRRSSVVR